MSTFRLKEWWHYRRAAKGRHGVHSPFVYRFIEEALRPPQKFFQDVTIYKAMDGTIWNGSDIMHRVVHYLQPAQIIVLRDADQTTFTSSPVNATSTCRLYEITDASLAEWPKILAGIALGGEDVIAVHYIHRTTQHASGWKALCASSQVRLSIDLFRMGLLFFSPDFKARQHFVLKYPA